MSQFDCTTVPEDTLLLEIEQPWLVWSVISLVLAEFTFSITSSSPETGQLGPRSQLEYVNKSFDRQEGRLTTLARFRKFRQACDRGPR